MSILSTLIVACTLSASLVLSLSNPCQLPPVTGNCRAAFSRFYYDASSDQCRQFTYGGCGGNGNNFLTRRDCNSKCTVISYENAEPNYEKDAVHHPNPYDIRKRRSYVTAQLEERIESDMQELAALNALETVSDEQQDVDGEGVKQVTSAGNNGDSCSSIVSYAVFKYALCKSG